MSKLVLYKTEICGGRVDYYLADEVNTLITQLTEQLRDRFAMAALTGFATKGIHADYRKNAIEDAFEIADEMMKARNDVS